MQADPDEYDPQSIVGEEVVLDEKDADGNEVVIEITQDMVDHKLVPAMQWFDDNLNPEQFWLEIEVHYDGPLKGAFGTADVLYVNGDEAGMVDWKFGDGVMVSAADNYQLMFYMAAALKLPWFAELTKGVKKFKCYIVQPIEGANRIDDEVEFTRKQLADFEKLLQAAHVKVTNGDETLTIGDWCQFCPAQEICPAWRDRGKEALENVPAETLKEANDNFDHDALRIMYMHALEVGAWAELVKKRVKREFDAGRPIDGLKRVVYQNNRMWADDKKATNWLRRQGLKAADYNEPATLQSVAALEKVLGKGKIKSDLIKQVPRGFQIVPLDDPRPAYEEGSEQQALSQQLADSLNQETT